MSKGIRVLLVDDLSSMRSIIKKILTSLKIEQVDEADDGRTAIPMLDDAVYDLILTDWNMKHVQGIDLVRAVRSHPNAKDTPIIMITAELKRSNVEEAIAAGIDNFVAKPFTAETLRNKINETFKRRKKNVIIDHED